MQINTKDLHKICGKLREDRFLTVLVTLLLMPTPASQRWSRLLTSGNRHTRPELREGNPRPSNRTWYYINYRHTIDAIKWRVYTIDKEVQGSSVPVNEKKEYFCSFCKAEWTAMEVLDSVGPDGFVCHRCQHTLTFEADRNAGGHEQSTRLNDQFTFISELLPKIDAVHIPECDFERALAKARPVIRDATHQRAETTAVDGGTNRPMAVKGLTNTGPQSMAVSISNSDGPSAAEREADRALKEQIAKQNVLPDWMQNSTVTGESFSNSAAAGASAIKQEEDGKGASQSKLVDQDASSRIDDIFEKLKAEQAEVRAKEIQEEDEDEEGDYGTEEDDDEFEDVPASSRDTTNTPAIKREPSGEATRAGDSSDERLAKRVKVEPEIKKEEDSEEDEDELEFEDV